MWIKDKVNDCYKMSHSHLITIEKVNRHYILYFRDVGSRYSFLSPHYARKIAIF